MERRTFLRNSLLTAGGVLLGRSAIFRFLKDRKPEEDFRPTTVETICQGDGKNVLVLMSAGTRQEHQGVLKKPIKWDWNYKP